MQLFFTRHSVSAVRITSSRGRHVSTTTSERLVATKRQRRDDIWIPQAQLTQSNNDTDQAGQLLVRAGYVRQAYSGIFQMLPLGLRVQDKLEALVDKHMTSLGASKVSLSSMSSQNLWDRTGRLSGGSEFFKFKDRKNAEWLLAPTHEEEITALVKDIVFSLSHLPVRVYQVTRKYRDEKRPRGGLLRGREFLMKDLYTFDMTTEAAHDTYASVRQAYTNFFDELKVPYIEAQADSGNMGGKLSHEYHFPNASGEDDVITCSVCKYARNEEFVPDIQVQMHDSVDGTHRHEPSREDKLLISEDFVAKDRSTLVKAFAKSPSSGKPRQINPYIVKAAFADQFEVDTGVEDPKQAYLDSASSSEKSQRRMIYLFDQSVSNETIRHEATKQDSNVQPSVYVIAPSESQSQLLKVQDGDPCPECAHTGRNGELKITKAIEVGHTFHLGDRYSSKLDFTVPKTDAKTESHFVSMGCHGIGVSRLIAAVASCFHDSTGLSWPRVIAPFEVVILADKKQGSTEVVDNIYDNLTYSTTTPADVLVDDREGLNFGWKLKDADLIGYPIIIVVGKGWVKKKLIEIQCRRLNIKEEIELDKVSARVQELLQKL